MKLDGCGQFRNLTWWYQLINATGKPILIENCHWGQTVPGDTGGDAPCAGGGDGVSLCPYNFFRTSGKSAIRSGSLYLPGSYCASLRGSHCAVVESIR